MDAYVQGAQRTVDRVVGELGERCSLLQPQPARPPRPTDEAECRTLAMRVALRGSVENTCLTWTQRNYTV